MGACDFSAVFSEICGSIVAGDSVSQVEIYSLLFDNYYLSHKDEAAILDKSDINKRKQGKMNAHSGIIKYYCQDPEALAYDIETNIIPLISDKYALRDTFINMVKCDSCSEEKKADTLSDIDDLPQFFANVIIHSFSHNSVQKNTSPDISERIISSVPKPCKTFSGRKKELSTLDEMLKAHDKIFVYGIGGIGKSEFVKTYISNHKKEYKNILYLTYESNLRTGISFKDDVPQETIAARLERHSEYLKLLKNDSLIIIDNFDILPDEDEYLDELLSYNCNIIFTTRNNFGDDYDTFELADIDRSTLFEIAEKFGLSNINHDTLDRIFAAAHDHTLACELIIRLLKKSAHTPDEILEMLMNNHVNIGASDKIRRSKTTDATKYSEHIRQLFCLFALSEEQQNMMRLLSLIPVAGISDKYFQFLTNTTDCEALRKKLCKNNQLQKNDFVVRAAARSLSFLFQYKLNTAVCQATDAKYPDATERSAVRSGYFAAHQFSLSGYIISSSPSTLPQSQSGIVHFLDISVVAGYSALSSAVSLGNTLLCLFRRR